MMSRAGLPAYRIGLAGSFKLGIQLSLFPLQSVGPIAHAESYAAPTRDPHTPGYVEATELSDGALPSPTVNGNFIVGPTHTPAPKMSLKEAVPQGTIYTFTMDSKDGKLYPGIAREPGNSARRTRTIRPSWS